MLPTFLYMLLFQTLKFENKNYKKIYSSTKNLGVVYLQVKTEKNWLYKMNWGLGEGDDNKAQHIWGTRYEKQA